MLHLVTCFFLKTNEECISTLTHIQMTQKECQCVCFVVVVVVVLCLLTLFTDVTFYNTLTRNAHARGDLKGKSRR